MITFGVITGFGLSLCYVAAVVIVAYYFERRRSFATGLSVCGGGIGTFLFAPISQRLIGKRLTMISLAKIAEKVWHPQWMDAIHFRCAFSFVCSCNDGILHSFLSIIS